MAEPKRITRSALDIGLVASLALFIAVLVNTSSASSMIATAALIALALLVTLIGIWRETARERALDEVELASESFGARSGISAVVLVTFLATFFAPLQGLIEWAASLFESAPQDPFPIYVRVFIMGLVCAMLIELTAKSIAAALWRRSKR